jgi:hypothetical protein
MDKKDALLYRLWERSQAGKIDRHTHLLVYAVTLALA